jgi:hypothetical protein
MIILRFYKKKLFKKVQSLCYGGGIISPSRSGITSTFVIGLLLAKPALNEIL